ncbi:MAG: YjdF family protein [Clostridiales bacterium]|nr:YjdF family protein [Clostridiales bacterium]
MRELHGQLTVFFDAPFWVGIFEVIEKGKLSVAKVTFGPEPREYEVMDYIQKHYYQLQFSTAVAADVKAIAKNPKRRQRQARRQMQPIGIGTRSQQALKLQQEQSKTERKTNSRERKEADKKLKFEMKQQKKKQKHRGR